MPIRETGANIFCGTCGHFIQHYIWNAGRFQPLGQGHCDRLRREIQWEGKACPRWVLRMPDQDPPQVRRQAT